MSGWIKFDKDMADDPRILTVAAQLLDSTYQISGKTVTIAFEDLSRSDALRFMSNALRGATVTLWCYADTHIRDDDTLPCDVTALDAIVGIEGFCASMPDEWIEILDDGTVRLPGYCSKNGLISKKKRAQSAAERQRRYRERINGARTAYVTRSVTHNGDGDKCRDLDQDLYQEKEASASSPSRKSSPKPKKSSRVPDGFVPDRAWALTEIPDLDVDREIQNFRDWEFKTPRSDWAATWRTWVRNSRSKGSYAKLNGKAKENGLPTLNPH